MTRWPCGPPDDPDELRRLLGVVRSDGEGPADLGPVPGLGVLDALADEMRQAGLEVEVRRAGPGR